MGEWVEGLGEWLGGLWVGGLGVGELGEGIGGVKGLQKGRLVKTRWW